jgi:hypothetical protein
MARDPIAPADPDGTQDTLVDPSKTIPQRHPPQGDPADLDGGDYAYWLRDGVTPYRSSIDGHDFEVFSRHDDAWMLQHMVDPDELWPSDAGEIASLIGGGRQRLTEPNKGAMPIDPGPGPDEDFAPVGSPDYLAEADSAADADTPQPPPSEDGAPASAPDFPAGGMTEQQIRDAGLRIDVPYDDPLPVALKYKDAGQQAWTPPPGFRQGMPPIDEKLAADLGVSRDLGAQEGAEGGTGSGESGEPG